MRRNLKANRTALEAESEPFGTEATVIGVQEALPAIAAPPRTAQPRPASVQISAAGTSSVYAPSIGPTGNAPVLSAVPSAVPSGRQLQHNNYPNAAANAPARTQKVRQADRLLSLFTCLA